MNLYYLLVNFFTILIPFVFSFHPKIKFHKRWYAFFPAVVLSSILFLIWDAYFTQIGVWGFNPSYLIDIFIWNLPLEEVLFFICIPYACVFTFHCLKDLLNSKSWEKLEGKFTIVLIISLLLVSILFYSRIYTFVSFFSLACLLAFSKYVLKIQWLPKFYLTYAVLLIPFFIVNGILTGSGLQNPIVWYNVKEIIGLRLFTIPLEDVFYGMELILLNLIFYDYLLIKPHKIS